MFVRYYVEVPLPAAQVEQALLASPAEWLSAMAGAAQERGDGLLTEVGVGPLATGLRRRVRIQLGEPVRFPSMTSLPLAWEPVGLEGCCRGWTPTSSSAPSAAAGPSSPSAPATGHPWGSSAGPSTGCCCTESPRRPSRTSSTGSGRPSP
jgi:hypothetical protein